MTRLGDEERVLPDGADKRIIIFSTPTSSSFRLTHVILMWELFYLLLRKSRLKLRRDNRQTPFSGIEFRVIKGSPACANLKVNS